MAVKKKRKAAKKRPVSRRASKKVIKKVIKKKPALKKRIALKKKPAPAKRKKVEPGLVGVVTHYFPHVRAAVVKVKAPFSVGDTIKVKGHTTDLKQAITSMQMDHVDIQDAKKGQEIGLMVESRVRRKDKIYKV